MPSVSSGCAEGEADRAGIDVGADEAEQDAEADHGDRLEHRAARQHHGRDQAEHHQREILRRSEFQRHFGKRRGEIGHHQRRDAAGDERADRGDAERRPGAALARHLVAVERGDDRRRFTRDVDQDRRGRAAVLRAVIDAGQHDQRRRRTEVERERQQHRHRRHRTDAGQHADQRAEEAADEAIDEVLPASARRQDRRPDCRGFPSAQASGQSGIGRPSSQTNTATENAISTATSPTVSSGLLSREANGADQHQRGDRRDQPEMRQRHAEQRDGNEADDDRPGMKARHRRAIDGEGAEPRSSGRAPRAARRPASGTAPGPCDACCPCRTGCDSPMKPSATATKNSPAQKSFGERIFMLDGLRSLSPPPGK